VTAAGEGCGGCRACLWGDPLALYASLGGPVDPRTTRVGWVLSTIGSASGSLDRRMAISAAMRPSVLAWRSIVVRLMIGGLLPEVLS
jgi:hypothetical protein